MHAEMAELADALVSGISDRKVMQVQVLFSAPDTAGCAAYSRRYDACGYFI